MSDMTTTVTKAAGKTAGELLERATEAAETARDAAVGFYEGTARPVVQSFVEGTALPAVQQVTSGATAKGAPLIAAGAGLVADKAAAVKEHADAQVQSVQGPSTIRRLFRLFAITGLLAVVAGVLAKKAGGKKEWASYEPAHSGSSTGSSAVPTPAEDLGQHSTSSEPEEVVYLDGLPVDRDTAEDPSDRT